MSNKNAQDIQKYLLIGGGLAATYLIANYLANRPASTAKSISLETTLTVIKEIKYQVYASCIAFAQGYPQLKATYPPKDLDIVLRTQLAKTYESKEDLILSKHIVSKDEYAIALKKYGKNPQIVADQAEILRVLEDGTKGKIDLTLPPAVTQLFSPDRLLTIYRFMCEEIGIKVWEKILECMRNNPAFNAKNEEHFRIAIREIPIYAFKVNYLAEQGLRTEWGCPNLNFLKLLEGEKIKDAAFKIEATSIEKGYEVVISKVSNDPEHYDRIKITRLMEDTIKQTKEKINKPNKPANQPQPVNPPKPVQQAPPPQPAQPAQPKKTVVAPKPAKKEEDDFDLEKMMMDQLMSRSQEEPKQEKVEPKPEQKPVRVPEVKPEAPAAPLVVSAPKVEIVESIAVEPVAEPVVEVAAEPVVEPVVEVAVEPAVEVAVEPVVEAKQEVPLVVSAPQEIESVPEVPQVNLEEQVKPEVAEVKAEVENAVAEPEHVEVKIEVENSHAVAEPEHPNVEHAEIPAVQHQEHAAEPVQAPAVAEPVAAEHPEPIIAEHHEPANESHPEGEHHQQQ